MKSQFTLKNNTCKIHRLKSLVLWRVIRKNTRVVPPTPPVSLDLPFCTGDSVSSTLKLWPSDSSQPCTTSTPYDEQKQRVGFNSSLKVHAVEF